MRPSLTLSLLALVGVISGCSVMSRSSATEIKNSNADSRNTWNAALVTPSELAGAMQVRGVANWARNDNGSRISVEISNATSGGVHPWHLHAGRCGENGPIVGDAGAYKALTVNSEGQAKENASLPMTLPMSGNYYVNIHAQSTNMGTIIACGNLAPPVM